MRRVLLVSMVLLVGCSNPPGVAKVDLRRVPAPGVKPGTWVAKYGGQELSDAELAQRFAEMNPYARARFQTVEQRRDYVEGVVRFDLLAMEAVKRGLQNDPEVIEAARRVMVQQLLKRELDEGAQGVTDAQVAAWYQSHQGDYVKPAMVRLAHLQFRKDHRAEAEAALEKARALQPLAAAAFGRLARELSEDEKTKAIDGDLRFLSAEELAQRYGQGVAEAAAKLEKVGDVFPELVETKDAYHVLKLQGRQPALDLSLEQAKASIQQLLANETRQERFRALVERLKKEANLELNDASIAAMVVDPKAPAVKPTTPAPGFMPPPVAVQ